jgi:hypothetical protein
VSPGRPRSLHPRGRGAGTANDSSTGAGSAVEQSAFASFTVFACPFYCLSACNPRPRKYHHIQELDRWFPSVFLTSRLVYDSWLRPILLHLRAPLVFMAGVFLVSSTARGGCEYPMPVEHSAPYSSASHNTGSPHTEPRLPNKPYPCQGPTCSRRPFVPPAPPSIESTTASEWARLIPQMVLVPPGSKARLPEEPHLRPQRLASSIYHPPRLS